MTKPPSNNSITNISDTSYWVAHYRAKESRRPDPLFIDPFAERLAGEIGKDITYDLPKISKYTEWSVIARTLIIDRFINKLVKEGIDGVINLGAGLDTRAYRMDLPKDLEWVEVDFEHILKYKEEILKSETPQCHLRRISLDLSDDDRRKEILSNLLSDKKKVLILTEGLIPYLDEEEVKSISNEIYAQDRYYFWIMEYFDPSVYPYLRKPVRQMKMTNSPFKFYPQNWNSFFQNLNWKDNAIAYTGILAKEFNRRPPMPLWTRMIFNLLPKKVKEESQKKVGYKILSK